MACMNFILRAKYDVYTMSKKNINNRPFFITYYFYC